MLFMSKILVSRRAGASLGALGGAVCMRSWSGGPLPSALWLPTLLLLASALLVWRRHVGGQLLARAVWWSNLILGTVIATTANGTDRPIAAYLALCTGGALLAVGRSDLHEATPSGSFLPLAFRGTLMCMLVMAMADAQSLLLFGALDVTAHMQPRQGIPIAIAIPLVASVIGLYRLRLWGLLLTLGGSALLAAAALSGALDVPGPLRVAYVVTAAAQWLVSLPLVVALIRRRAPAAPSLRTRGYAATAALVGLMMAASLGCAFVLRAPIY
jgi:hypothetical protein